MERIRLTWMGAAGFHVGYRGGELLLDPLLSSPGGGASLPTAVAPDLRAVSLILISHGHFDHAMDAGRLARQTGAAVFAPRSTCDRLRSEGIAGDRLHPNERQERLAWNGITIRVVPSRHMQFDLRTAAANVVRTARGGVLLKLLRMWGAYPMGSTSEFLLDFAGYSVLFSGSGGGDWAALAALRPDCALLPYADRSDLPDYYVKALKVLSPGAVVLHHFDRVFPHLCHRDPIPEFRDRLASACPGIRLIVPEPGTPFSLP